MMVRRWNAAAIAFCGSMAVIDAWQHSAGWMWAQIVAVAANLAAVVWPA